MKTNWRIVTLNRIVGLSVFCSVQSFAQQQVPCLIFSGNADREQALDLSKFNRIYFLQDGMSVGSSGSDSEAEIQLTYPDYHHFRIGLAVPQSSSGIDEINNFSAIRLLYLSDTKSIFLESTELVSYKLQVYNASGLLVATTKINSGQSFPVGSMSQGLYIAVAADGKNKKVLKFIVK